MRTRTDKQTNLEPRPTLKAPFGQSSNLWRAIVTYFEENRQTQETKDNATVYQDITC